MDGWWMDGFIISSNEWMKTHILKLHIQCIELAVIMNFIRYIQQKRICEHFSYLDCLPYARGMLCVNLAWHECFLRTFVEMRAKIQKLSKIRTEKKTGHF